jgi:hypothetical protein
LLGSQKELKVAMLKSPHKQVALKFGLLICVLLGYFGYLSYEYGFATGGIVTVLTWSFFVLCTPVADAGFILDFPLRLLFGIRMVVSEIAVWVVAFAINAIVLIVSPASYSTTAITDVFHTILVTPYPYWAIIILSGLGTFLSVHFGDELMSVLHHRDRSYFHSHHFKHELILIAFFIIALIGYSQLITSVGLGDVLH